MGDKSDIQWTDATANVVVGCSRVSDGCRHCYAESLAATRLKHTERYKGLAIVTDGGKPQWTGKVRLAVNAIEQVIRWQKPRRIFLTAMGDPFHESLSNEQIAALFGLMAVCPQHTFQVLTKRAKRMREWFGWAAEQIKLAGEDGNWTPFARELVELLDDAKLATRINEDSSARAPSAEAWPLPNVWLGVSVEDQRSADERIPELLATPAAVRFLSCEPLLGPVDLAEWIAPMSMCSKCGEQHDGYIPGDCQNCSTDSLVTTWGDAQAERWRTNERYSCPEYVADMEGPSIHWVIVGGESGPRARPFNLAWARSIVAQCKNEGALVPCFVKQLGAEPVDGDAICKCGHTLTEHWLPFPAPCRHRHRPLPATPCEAVRLAMTLEPAGACPCIGFSPKDRHPQLAQRDSHGGDMSEWPEDLRVQQFPKTGGAT